MSKILSFSPVFPDCGLISVNYDVMIMSVTSSSSLPLFSDCYRRCQLYLKKQKVKAAKPKKAKTHKKAKAAAKK